MSNTISLPEIATRPQIVDPTFNLQRTFEQRTVGNQTEQVVTELVVEAAQPLILTQDPQKANQLNHLYVPDTAHVKVYGDEVTVSGKLSFPGRNIVIFARILRAEADGANPPIISVDGAELAEDKAKPKALAKGQFPPNQPNKVKIAKGATVNGIGVSATAFPDQFNGENGHDGEPGNPAGHVWICCQKTDFSGKDQKLTITAMGGAGGEGQAGQDGGDGGDGGNGTDFVAYPLVYKAPTAGGSAGDGGNGGQGGKGGQGGDGGAITVHCITAQPAVTVACDGGKGGERGAGGQYGEAGREGKGGKGGWYNYSGGRSQIPDASDGSYGHRGGPGERGDLAPPSKAGSSNVGTGEVLNTSLAQIASVTQLQMLFERTRSDYLLTEPPDYSLRLMAIAPIKDADTPTATYSVTDLVNTGRNLVVVALVANNLQIRIFDAGGQIVVDKAESELAGSERVTALEKRFEMTFADVLLAGRWRTADQLKMMSDAEKRQALAERLRQLIKGLAGYHNIPDGDFNKLSDYTLMGIGAEATFVLEMGIRDEASLKMMTDDEIRNTLIVEIGEHTGYDGPTLWGMDNQRLVRVALEPRPGNRFVLRGSMVGLRDHLTHLSSADQEQIIADAGELVGYTDPWTRIGDRLNWLVRLLNGTSKDYPLDRKQEHPQKALAKTLWPSAWSAINNYRNNLDYFGKTPQFVPVLSLDTYIGTLKESVQLLAEIETEKNAYFLALGQQTDATSSLRNAVTKAAGQLDYLNAQKAKINRDLSKIAEIIHNDYDQPLQAAKPALNAALEYFGAEVREAFGLSWATFFNCLSMLSFANVNEPANATKTLTKVGGYASAAAMAGSQLGAMINEGFNNVLNDSGEPINKNLILQQIDVIKSDVDLQSEFIRRGDGFFNAAGSTRLVVELTQFRDLCKQFYKLPRPASAKVSERLDAYITLITTRNSYIDYYNLMVQELIDLTGEIKGLTLKKDSLSGNLASIAQPGLPAYAMFVSGLYERAKAACLSQVYHAYRAYAFWFLEPYSGFFDLLGHSPGAITAAQLKSNGAEFTGKILTALETVRGTPNIFPPKEESESSIGIVVVLTRDSHQDFFDDLESYYEAEFTLEPATKASTTPSPMFTPTVAAWCGSTRPNCPPNLPNPFHGKANVRLTKVRVWMVGMTTSTGDHSVILEHLGAEQFRNQYDLSYPTRTDPPSEPDQDKRQPVYVRHKPVPIPFNYNSEGLSYDPAQKYPFTPGKLFGKNVAGAQDGDLGFPKEGDVTLPQQSSYAPIGPFGRWRVIVRPEDNGDPKILSFAKLNAIVIDFHGFHQTFAR